MSDQPKPATGEWTLETLAKLGVDHEWMRPLCDAHNAALAAEERKGTFDVMDIARKAQREIEELRKQLAAEREKVQTLVDALKGMLDVYEELHARYDLGDCQATVDAQAALAKVKEGK